MDATQTIKAQIGELIWNNAILVAELEKVTKERDELKNGSQKRATSKGKSK